MISKELCNADALLDLFCVRIGLDDALDDLGFFKPCQHEPRERERE